MPAPTQDQLEVRERVRAEKGTVKAGRLPVRLRGLGVSLS
jgi:hypothetical protein